MSMNGKNNKPSHAGVYEAKEIIHDVFQLTGYKQRLMAFMRFKAAQHGWTETMRDKFLDYIRERGPDNVNVSHMIADLAPLGRELFPSELKKELVETMVEEAKKYFTIDDTVTPITDPDNPNSEAEKTFLYQSRDVMPDPGLGVGVEVEIPSSPASSNAASTIILNSKPDVEDEEGDDKDGRNNKENEGDELMMDTTDVEDEKEESEDDDGEDEWNFEEDELMDV